MLGRGRFLAERLQHRKTAQRLGTEGCQCVRLQTKRDKSRVAMSGQVRRDACESLDDESHERSGIQKATCWSYVTQSGIPYCAENYKTGDSWRGASWYDCLDNSLLWVLASDKYIRALFCCKGPAGLFA